MIIDTFCHIYLPKASREKKATAADQSRTNPKFYDEDYRLKYMDRFGVDMEVLSATHISGEHFELSTREALLEETKALNSGISDLVGKHQDRMLGVATLPLLDGEFLDELDRSIQDLGLKGCLIYSNTFGKPVDSSESVSFYDKMAKHDLPIFIHPTNWSYYEWITQYGLDRKLGWPFDSSIAMGRIVFGGILERFPTLKIVVHHLGGMIPYFSDRVAGNIENYGLDAKKLSKPAMEYFKMFYGDTMVQGSMRALKCGVDFFTPDHVVFATDYPFGPQNGEYWTPKTIQNVREMGLSAGDQEKIFEKNARRLLKIK